MLKINEIAPLYASCRECKASDTCGIRWKCGHISCCAKGMGDRRWCPIPECRAPFDQELNFQLPSHLRLPNFSIVGEAIVLPPELQCRIHPEPYTLFLRVQGREILFTKKRCPECFRRLDDKKKNLKFIIKFSRPVVFDFARVYSDLDRRLKQIGVDLSFRDALDQVVGQEVEQLVQVDPTAALLPDSPFAVVSEFGQFFITIKSRVLVRLGDLLGRLARSLQSHSHESLLQKLAEFLEIDQTERWCLRLLGAAPETPVTQTVRTLLSQEWPISLPIPQLPRNRFVQYPAAPREHRQPPAVSRAVHSLVWRRNHSKWRQLAAQSKILRPGETPFLASLFPLLAAAEILGVFEEEEGSAFKFRKASQGKINTAVFIQSEQNRFGCFTSEEWGVPKGKCVETTFMFSLSEKREVRLIPDRLLKRPADRSLKFGPALACSIIRPRRHEKNAREK